MPQEKMGGEFTVVRVRIWNVKRLFSVRKILHACGKHMAKHQDLHHWDNSFVKSLAIVVLCALKNRIYLVFRGGKPAATFQTRKIGRAYQFEKLATSPDLERCGIGSFCLACIEDMAIMSGCDEVICDVYDKSERAKSFYLNRGFTLCGTEKTVKYVNIKLSKKVSE